jgi:hypothetical protein
VIGILSADKLEDYLELRDSQAKAAIAASKADLAARRIRPAQKLLEVVLD